MVFLLGITSSATELKTCAITAEIKKYKPIIKKKKKHNKIKIKNKLNSMEVLISKSLIDSNIRHEEFVLKINAIKEYDDMN